MTDPDAGDDEVAPGAGRWRAGGWGAVAVGLALAPATSGVSLLGTLAGVGAITHAGRRREAAREAQARTLLAEGRIEVGPATPWDAGAAGAWLTAVARRRVPGDGTGR